MADIRIKDLPEALDIEEADYVAVDNAGDGTRRFRLGSLRDETSIAQSFVITVSHTPGSATSYSSDKTFAEITSAISEGLIPTLKLGETYCVLLEASETGIVFMRNAVDYKSSIVIAPDDSVTLMNYEMTSSDIPNESAVQASTVTGAFNVLSYSVNSLSSGVTDANNAIASLDGRVTALESGQGGGGGGLTQTEKNLMLELFSKAAYPEADAEVAYEQLVELWASSTKNITYNLSSVTSSNLATSIERGQTYTSILTTTSEGYAINYVNITMGGVDITPQAYSSGTVSIRNVTGDIVITATAVLAATSITAVYTQLGTVFDNAPLVSLKDDLVVTANYSGGGSATVSSDDYTLSGTLNAGTSTITVSYAGLTTTFNVDVTHWDNAIISWDFTRSLTDSKQGLTATLNNGATQDSNGIHINASNAYVALATSVLGENRTYEIDVAAIDASSWTTGAARLFVWYPGNGSGLSYSASGVWTIYDGSWETPPVSYTDKDFFANSTIKIVVGSGSTQYKRSLTFYKDDTLLFTMETNKDPTYSTYIPQFGYTNGSVRNMTITGFRVYSEE